MYDASVSRKKTIREIPKDLPVFGVGETVRIMRPNLWFAFTGEVVSESGGIHRVKVTGNAMGGCTSAFHAAVRGDELESYI